MVVTDAPQVGTINDLLGDIVLQLFATLLASGLQQREADVALVGVVGILVAQVHLLVACTCSSHYIAWLATRAQRADRLQVRGYQLVRIVVLLREA